MKKSVRYLRKSLGVFLVLCILLSSISVSMSVLAAEFEGNNKAYAANAYTPDAPEATDAYRQKLLKMSNEEFTQIINYYIEQSECRSNRGSMTQKKLDAEANLMKIVAALVRDERTVTGDGKTGNGYVIEWVPKPTNGYAQSETIDITDTIDGLFSKLAQAIHATAECGTNEAGNNKGDSRTQIRNYFEDIFKPALKTILTTTQAGETTPAMTENDFSADGPRKINRFINRMAGAYDQGFGSDGKTTAGYNFKTREIPNREYLLRYATLNDVPDTVWTRVSASYCNQQKGSLFSKYYTLDYAYVKFGYNSEMQDNGSVSNGHITPPDTTSKSILQNFNNVFTESVLNLADPNNATLLSKAQFDAISQASALMNNITAMSNAVGDHFFKTSTANYEEAAFDRAKTIYAAVQNYIQQAKDNYVNTANTLHNTYSGYMIDDNYQNMTLAEIQDLESGLTRLDNMENILSENQKTLPEVVDAKDKHTQLADLLNKAVKAVYPVALSSLFSQIDALIDNPDDLSVLLNETDRAVVSENNITLYDNGGKNEGTVAKVAALYMKAAQTLMPLDKANNIDTNNNLLIFTRFIEEYEAYRTSNNLAYDNVRKDNIDKIFTVIGFKNAPQTTGDKNVVIKQDKLAYEFSKISDIPASFNYDQTAIVYSYYNATIPDNTNIRLANTVWQDSISKAKLAVWDDTFNTEFMGKDLNTITYEEAIAGRTAILTAQDAIKDFRDLIRNHLLKPTEAEINTLFDAYEISVRETAVKKVDVFYNKYKDAVKTPLTAKERKAFVAAYENHVMIIGSVTDAYRNQSVTDAEIKLQQLVDDYGNYQIEKYLEAAAKLDPWIEKLITQAQPVTHADTLKLGEILYNMETSYATLTDTHKLDPRVVLYQEHWTTISNLLKNFKDTPEWQEYHVDMSNIQLPEGVQASQLIEVLEKLLESDEIKGLLGIEKTQNLGDFLSNTISENLFTDATINMLMEMLYPMVVDVLKEEHAKAESQYSSFVLGLAGIGSVNALMEKSGINASVWRVYNSNAIDQGYKEVYTEIQRVAEANDVNVGWDKVDFSKFVWDYTNPDGSITKIHDVETFSNALGTMLKAIWPIITVLLTGDTISIKAAGIINLDLITGAKGYENVVRPFLLQLGCPESEVLTSAQLNEIKHYTNSNKFIYALLSPIMNRITAIGSAPAESIINLLPTLGYLFNYNMIEKGLNELVAPFGMSIGEMLADSGIDLGDINALVGMATSLFDLGDIDLQLPYIDAAKLSGIAKKVGNGFSPTLPGTINLEVKRDEMVIFVLRFALDALKDNKKIINNLLPESSGLITSLLDKALSRENDQIINALYGILFQSDIPEQNWADIMAEWAHSESEPIYPEGVTKAMSEKAVQKIDALLNEILNSFMDTNLTSVINENLFTQANLNQLATTIYGLLGSEDIAPIFDIIGLDLSQEAIANSMADYPAVAQAIRNAEQWPTVDFTGVEWYTSNQSADFAKALATILAPLNPLLKVILAGEDYSLLNDAISIKGANGYANTVLPLLKALNVTELPTSDDYLLAIQNDTSTAQTAMLTEILIPVFNYIETAVQSPVQFVTSILPNVSYYINNGGLTTAIYNLLLPITNITDHILPLFADVKFSDDGSQEVTPTLPQFVIDLIGEDTLPAFVANIDFENIDASINAILTNVLQDVELAEGYPLNFINIDWEKFASAGTLKDDEGLWIRLTNAIQGNNNTKYVEANTSYTFVLLLNYVLDLVKANSDSIFALLGTSLDQSIKDLLITVLANPSMDITGAIIKILNEPDIEDDAWDMTNFNHRLSEKLYKDADEQRVKESMVTLDKLIDVVLTDFVDIDLSTTVTSALSDDTVKTLMQTIYNAISNETVKSVTDILGIQTAPKQVAEKLADYSAVQAVLAKYDTWADVFTDSDWVNVSFGIDNGAAPEAFATSFAKALAAVLSPFEELLNLLINNGSFTLLDTHQIKGANGYKNVIQPLLSALGVSAADGLLTPDEFAATAQTDGVLLPIIKPLISFVLRVADSPVDTLTDILPNFAFFMDNGGLTRCVNNLLKPLTAYTDIILDLFKDENGIAPTVDEFILDLLGDTVTLPEGLDLKNLENSIIPVVNSFLQNITIAEQTISLSLPAIDWAELAGRGTVKTSADAPFFARITGDKAYKYVEADKADVFMAVLTYIANLLSYQDNPAAIKTLVKSFIDSALVDEIINNVTTANPADLVQMIINLLAPTSDGLLGNWIYKDIKSQTAKYTPNLTEKDFIDAIPKFDKLILDMLPDLIGSPSLNTFISDTLYNDATVNSIASMLFGALGSDDLKDIIDLAKQIGIDLTPTGLASLLTEDKYSSVKNALNQATQWADIDFTALKWNVTNGNKDQFLQALTAMLRPFNDVLNAVLNGKDLVLLDTITIKAGYGYNNAIIPLLETLGCSNILTSQQYANAVAQNPDNLILEIVKPVFARLEQLLAEPISILTEALPNIAYFMYNGGLQQLADNLLLPITKVLKEIAPVYNVELDLSMLTDLDVTKVINDLLANIELNGAPLGLKLKNINWEEIAACGTPEKYTSAMLVDASDPASGNVAATRIAANKPQVLVTVLRYLVSTLQDPENVKLLPALLSGMDLGGLENLIVTVLPNLETDAVIEILFGLLFNEGNGGDNGGNNSNNDADNSDNNNNSGNGSTGNGSGSGSDNNVGQIGNDSFGGSYNDFGSDSSSEEDPTSEEAASEETVQPSEDTTVPAETAETEKDLTWIYITAALAGVALIIILIVAKKKKPDEE